MDASAPARRPLPPGVGSRRGSRRSYFLRVAPYDLKLYDAAARRVGLTRAEWVRMQLRLQVTEHLLIDCLRPVPVRKGFRLWRADGAEYALDVLTSCGVTDGRAKAWVHNIAFGQPPERCRSGAGAVLVFPRKPHEIYVVDLEAVPAVLRGGHGPPIDPVAAGDHGAGSRRSPTGRGATKRGRGTGDHRKDGSGCPPASVDEIPVVSPVARAIALLRPFLAVPRPSADGDPDGVPAFARAHGIGRSTLRQARKALGVVAEKAGGNLRGGWVCRLPGCGAPSPLTPGTAGTDGTTDPLPASPAGGDGDGTSAGPNRPATCEAPPDAASEAIGDADAAGVVSPTPAPPPEAGVRAPVATTARRPCDDPGHWRAGSWTDWWGGAHCDRCEPPDPRLARPTEAPPPTA